MSRVFISLGKWLPYANIKYTTIVPSPKVWHIQTCCFAKSLCRLFFGKWSFPLSVFPGLSGSSASATKSQEVPLNAPLLKRLSLSIHGEDAGNPCACVFVYVCKAQMVCQLEVKRGCRGGERAVCSCPDRQNGWGHRWDFSLVDFSSQLAPVCLERHGNLD